MAAIGKPRPIFPSCRVAEPATMQTAAVTCRRGCGAAVSDPGSSWGRAAVLAVLLAMGGCQHLIRQPPPPVPAQVTPFSSATPGGPFPGAWHIEAALKFRKPSTYRLVDDGGTT